MIRLLYNSMIIFENVDDLQLKKKYIFSLNMFLEMIFFG